LGANNYILVQFDTLLISLTSLRKWRHHFCFEKTFNISICNRTKTSAAKVISIDRSQRKSNLPASCSVVNVIINRSDLSTQLSLRGMLEYVTLNLKMFKNTSCSNWVWFLTLSVIWYRTFFDDTFQLLRSRSWNGRKSIKPVYPVWQAGTWNVATNNNKRKAGSVRWLVACSYKKVMAVSGQWTREIKCVHWSSLCLIRRKCEWKLYRD